MEGPHEEHGEEASSAMSVNSVGGAASLPLSVTGSAAPVTGTSTAADAAGEVRLPGQHQHQHQHPDETKETRDTRAAEQARLKEASTSVPLKGLTVAEIRAMLGVPPLPGQTGGEPVPPTTTSASQTYLRYA